jgi:hypothetical protein
MNETPDFQAATQAQQRTWSKGDFAVIASVVPHDADALARCWQRRTPPESAVW